MKRLLFGIAALLLIFACILIIGQTTEAQDATRLQASNTAYASDTPTLTYASADSRCDATIVGSGMMVSSNAYTLGSAGSGNKKATAETTRHFFAYT